MSAFVSLDCCQRKDLPYCVLTQNIPQTSSQPELFILHLLIAYARVDTQHFADLKIMVFSGLN